MARATTATAEQPSTVGVKRLARAGFLAVVLASVVNGLVRVIAVTAVDVPPVFPLGWGPVIASSAIGAIGATVVYGFITHVSTRPNRTFTIVAAIVLVLSFAGPVNAFLSPPPGMGVADAPWTVFATLEVMHLTGAVAIVGVLTRRSNPDMERR